LPRAVSFKLNTADFESINLTEDSQVYLSLTKRVSHNTIRGREGRHRPPLPFRTVHETFTSHGS